VSAANKIYFIELTGEDNNFIADAYVGEGFISNLAGNYHYFLMSNDNKVLDTFTFGVQETFEYHTHTQSGSPEDITTGFYQSEVKDNLITAAYFPTGNLIRLTNPDGATLAEIDVSRFADFCGDNICQDQESYESCQLDCPSGGKDDYCDGVLDNICDPDCLIEQDIDCKQKETEKIVEGKETKPHILALIIALIVLVSVIIFSYFEFRKINNQNKKITNQKNLRNYQDRDLLRLRAYIAKELKKGFSKEQIRNVLIKNGWKDKKIREGFKGLR